MTKLFFRLCEAESFVDFVPLTFVTDERTYITLVPENARYHNGNAYDLMRLCIGCSDFTIDAIEAANYGPYNGEGDGEYWTYNDVVDEDTDGDGIFDADTDLSEFSIQGDIDANIISTIKDILEINPDVRFFASMWSAPAWMKKNESIIWKSGQVQPELKDEYCTGCFQQRRWSAHTRFTMRSGQAALTCL